LEDGAFNYTIHTYSEMKEMVGAQYRQLLEENYEEFSIIWSAAVKHVWEVDRPWPDHDHGGQAMARP
jgi:hypothetical protein